MSIPTELLGIIIENLGDEAESQPTNSIAFQTLLSFSLTGHRALPQCRRNIFRVLTIDSSRSKRRSISVAEHLKVSLNILNSDSHSHLARHIRRLAIYGSRAVKEEQARGSESLSEMRASFYSIIPKILAKLDRLESLFLDGVTGSPMTFQTHQIPPSFLDSLYAFLRRDVSVNNLKELQVHGLKGFSGSILSELPPTLKVLKCSRISTTALSRFSEWTPAEPLSESDGPKWRYQLSELDIENNYSLVKPMLDSRSGWPLTSLRSLSCWIGVSPDWHAESLVRMIYLSSSTLRHLEIASYRGSARLRNIIEKDALPILPNVQTLALTTELHGAPRNRTDSRCPRLIPSFFRYMAKKCPGLHKLEVHAIWSFRGTDPGSRYPGQSWFISGSRGWHLLDDLLGGSNPGHRFPHLRLVLVRATPAPMKFATSFYCASRSPRMRSPTYWFPRANAEIVGVLVETEKRFGVEGLKIWHVPDERIHRHC